MRRYRQLLLSLTMVTALLLPAVQQGFGQTIDVDHDQDHDHGFTVDGKYYGCGTEWASDIDYDAVLERTRQVRPEVYRKMMAEAEGKGEQLPQNLSVDGLIIKDWYVVDRDDGSSYAVTTKLVYYDEESKILIWLDVADTARLNDTMLFYQLAQGLVAQTPEGLNSRDPNKGVLYNDIDIFGDPPANRGDWADFMCSFVLTDIKEPSGLTGAIIAGYFSPFDQQERVGSNRQNVLYIDDNQGLQAGLNKILGTMAHEFQHLINHGKYTGTSVDASTHWIYNEGLSEVASLRNGYRDRWADPYLSQHANYSFFAQPDASSSGADILRAYERAMLWIHYLSQRFGDSFLKEVIKADGQGITPVSKAMTALQIPGTAEDVYLDFWVANYMRNLEGSFHGDAKYEYTYPVANNQPAVATNAIKLPSSDVQGQAEVKGFDSYFFSYRNSTEFASKGVGITFNPTTTGRPYGAYAIITRRNGDQTEYIEVQKLNLGERYNFDRFSAITFMATNLYGDGNTITWNLNLIQLGVDDYRSDNATFGIASVAPNPLSERGNLTISVEKPQDLSIDLFDSRGALALNVVTDRHFEAGSHPLPLDVSSLPSGIYTLRMKGNDGKMAVRQIVVTK